MSDTAIPPDEPPERPPRRTWADYFRLKKDRDIIDVIDATARVMLPILALILAVNAHRLQVAVQERTAQEGRIATGEEIERRHGAALAARAANAAEVSAALLGLALRGTAAERRSAVIGLAQTAPRQLIDASSALLTLEIDEQDKAFIREMTAQAAEHDIITEFLNQMTLSREFFRHALYERACDEFSDAVEMWPGRYDMDESALDRGRALCTARQHEEGARKLHRAFSHMPRAR
jgi:hypothetical protein